MRNVLLTCIAGLLLGTMPIRAAPLQQPSPCCEALDLHALTTLDALMPKLLDKQLVFIGEMHDQYAHHLAQLEIIRRLHQAHPGLVIAMEQFRQPSQPDLDDYIAERIDEKTLLQRTRFFETSGFDYRLFRPVVKYARDMHIPILALNIPDEISHKVAQGGLAALAGDERKWIPAEIDRENLRYRKRVNDVYRLHPQGILRGFENFLDAQLLWDEGMAARAAEYLQAHAGIHMVILAGSGHLIYGDGIPSRLVRRSKLSSAIVLNDVNAPPTPDMGDILLLQPPQNLPPAGNLGLTSTELNGSLRVNGLDDDSAAGAAGILVGDTLAALDGERVATAADLSIALLDKAPGDEVRLRIRRAGWGYAPQRELEFAIILR